MKKRKLTAQELSQFDGRNGQPAYVAINGTAYDVSGKKAWAGGKRHGNLAGHNLTDVLLKRSPHGDKALQGLPVVGQLSK